MKIKQLTLGDFQANCFLIIDESSKEIIVIDPGAQGENLIDLFKIEGYIPKMILLTHGHIDHIGGVEALIKEYAIPVYAGEKERKLLENPMLNLSGMMGLGISIQADVFLKEFDEIKFHDATIRVIETPGHTKGGISYLMHDVIFTGDTLFQGSIGRTDFPTGDFDEIMRSIIHKILVYPDEYIICPGHGFQTTVGEEKRKNPFVLSYKD